MERIIELIGIFLSAIISLVLAMFGLPLEIWIISGLGVLFLWIILVLYYETRKLKKENNELRQTIRDKSAQIKKVQESNSLICSHLKKRSTTAIVDFLKEATHDFYISGIINNSVINTFINNNKLLEECCRKGVKIHILFYVSDDEDYFIWYLKMLYGNEYADEKINIDKNNYLNCIKTINEYNVFTSLIKKDILQIRRLNTPATTAFIARDIERHGGKIQCQFYQYKLNSPDSPTYQLVPSDEMFATMKDVILDMWNSASTDLSVDYI